MGEAEAAIAELQLARNVAAVRLTEIETAWREAANQSALTDQQYHAAGLVAVKAQGQGGSRGSMSTAHNALTEAERVNMEAKALATQLGMSETS